MAKYEEAKGRRNENAAAYQSMMKSGENINRENNVGAKA
jgi:hypothetical protein